MEKTVEIIIPEERKLITEQYCDICEKKTTAYQRGDCSICNRHLCQEHLTYEYEDSSDLCTHYCKDCNQIKFKEFKKEYDDLEERHYAEEQALEDKVKEACFNKINKSNNDK